MKLAVWSILNKRSFLTLLSLSFVFKAVPFLFQVGVYMWCAAPDSKGDLVTLLTENRPVLLLPPGTTTTVDTTAAARTRATSSPSPSPSSPSAWVKSSSRKRRRSPPFLQQTHPHLVTTETGCSPCPSAWASVWITTPAGCIFTTPTPWGAFMRGRWIVREPCIQRLASWAAARFNWKISWLPNGWPSEGGGRGLMHHELHSSLA